MPETGQTISHYKILEKIGVGGMGEVYLAEDLSLDRKVALKFLPDIFTGDPERMARFEREAKLLASLNHPNIAAIYGLEQEDGKRFLVMEYVEGETLQARISKGALPVEDALIICRQIAEGLEAANEKGVIHRDLKPANVMITGEEKVKILDFGLAKALLGEGQSVDSSQSPTITEAMTQPGVVLGTAAYMSPEQAKGKSVDRRADIWAFGCILYECLSGKKVFGGETVTEALAAILRGDPDWQALPDTTPPNIKFVLRRCLEKDVSRRFRDAADVQIQIEEGLPSTASPKTGIPETKGRRDILLFALGAVALLILGGIAAWILKPSPPPAAQDPAHVVIDLPPGDQIATETVRPIAISPNGQRLAYVAIRNGVQQLFVRQLDSYEAIPLPGTEGAQAPFFSPDSAWVGFFAGGSLKKVSLAGGTAISICESGGVGGATWGKDDAIIFAPSLASGLLRVSAGGGKPHELTALDRSKGESSHRWPQLLPGDKAMLFTIAAGVGWDGFDVAALRLDTGEISTVINGGHTGRFVPTGHLVHYRAGELSAVPFDPINLGIIGKSSVTVAKGIRESGTFTAAEYSFSNTGALAYVPASLRQLDRRLVWVDREGNVEPIPAAGVRTYYSEPWFGLSISPDGQRAAVEVTAGKIEIWIYDIARGTMTRLTTEGGSSQCPIWTPDGTRITYLGYREGFRNIYWKNADGTGAEDRLTTGGNMQIPLSWSREGNFLAFSEINSTTGQDIYTLRLDGDEGQKSFLNTSFNEFDGRFSPDGRWLAYFSNETDRDEVYVQPFPGPGPRERISIEGGTAPRWASSGRELFYRNGDKMMVVDIQTEPTFKAGTPRLLFEGQFGAWDVAPDGQRFLMVQSVEPEQPPTKIHLILNWFEELKEQVPAD